MMLKILYSNLNIEHNGNLENPILTIQGVWKIKEALAHNHPFHTHTLNEAINIKTHIHTHPFTHTNTHKTYWRKAYSLMFGVVLLETVLYVPQTVWCYNSGTSCVSFDHHQKKKNNISRSSCVYTVWVCECVLSKSYKCFFFSFVSLWPQRNTIGRMWILFGPRQDSPLPQPGVTQETVHHSVVTPCDRMLTEYLYVFWVIHTKYSRNPRKDRCVRKHQHQHQSSTFFDVNGIIFDASRSHDHRVLRKKTRSITLPEL